MKVPPIKLPNGSGELLGDLFWLVLVVGIFVGVWFLCALVIHLIFFVGRTEDESVIGVSAFLGLVGTVVLSFWKGSLATFAATWVLGNIGFIILGMIALAILGKIAEACGA